MRCRSFSSSGASRRRMPPLTRICGSLAYASPQGVALFVGDHLERELVVVPQEDGPLTGVRQIGCLRDDVDDGMAVLLLERHVNARHQRKVKRHVAFVAVAEVRAHVARPLVRLGQQEPAVVVFVHRPAQALQHRMRLGQALAVGALALDEVWHGVEPHPVDAHVEPEPHDLGHRAGHARVVEVQVGLVTEEAMPVVGLGHRVPRPVGRLGVGEDDACLLVRAWVVAPDVEVALGRTGRRPPCGLKPRMLIGRVVDDELGDHLQVGVVGRAQERAEVLERAVAGMHALVVGDVVPSSRRGEG